MAAAGGAQTGEGEQERAEELQDAERILARVFVGDKEERRRGSACGRQAAALMERAAVDVEVRAGRAIYSQRRERMSTQGRG